MRSLLVRLMSNAFLKHNAIYFAGSLAFGALNYLYYPVVGRLVNPVAFGEIQTLVSFFLQLTIFLTVLGMVTANISANYENIQIRNRIIFDLERVALGISVLLCIACLIFGPQLQSFLHFTSPWPFAVLALGVIGDVPFTFRAAYVCGQHGFGRASLTNLLSAVVKIVCSVGLVLFGFGTIGAIWGVTISQFIAFFYIAYWAHRLGLRRSKESGLFGGLDLRILLPELKYAGFVLICSLIITLQFSVDIIVVKHYFDARTAGLYAGVATVARIIFFVTAAFAQVLMPSVKLKNPSQQNRRLLVKSFYLFGAIGLPVVGCFVLFPQTVLKLLMGSQYAGYAHMLPLLSLAIFIVSITNLVVAYFMALRRYSVMVGVLIGGIVTYSCMFIAHQDIGAVINDLFYGGLCMLVAVSASAMPKRRRIVIGELEYDVK